MEKEITELTRQLGQVLKEKKMTIVTSESCTGGGIAQAITEISGSSVWFDRGFVTYSNKSKVQLLQVKKKTLEQYGAVSKEVAIEMAVGALNNSDAALAVSVTGIAGPGGGTDEKPVGTVFIAVKKIKKKEKCHSYVFSGNRMQIRQRTVQYALELCMEYV